MKMNPPKNRRECQALCLTLWPGDDENSWDNWNWCQDDCDEQFPPTEDEEFDPPDFYELPHV